MDLLTLDCICRIHVTRDHYFCEIIYQHGLTWNFFNDLLSFLAPLVFVTSVYHAFLLFLMEHFPPMLPKKYFIYGLPKRPKMYGKVLEEKKDGKKRTEREGLNQ